MKKYQTSLGEKKIIKDQSLLQYEEIKNQIRILPELEQLIPPLLEDEFRQLEQNIIREGCREALLVWQTSEEIINLETQNIDTVFVLIDGHNRYNICKKYVIDFKIHLVNFKNLYDVRQYMIDNQLGRRNLSPEQISFLRGMKYLTEKKEKGKYERLDHKGHFVPYDKETVSTSEKLGERFKVSAKTIKRDAEFASGLEKLTPELKSDILSGKTKVNKTLIQQVGKTVISTLPLPTIDAIEEAVSVVPVHVKAIPKPNKESKKDVLISRLMELTGQLRRTGDVTVCDEIIGCASKIKKLAAKRS